MEGIMIIDFLKAVKERLGGEACTPRELANHVIELDSARSAPIVDPSWPEPATQIWEFYVRMLELSKRSTLSFEPVSFHLAVDWVIHQLETHEDAITPWAFFDALYRSLDHIPDIEALDAYAKGNGPSHRSVLMLWLDAARISAAVVGGERLGDDIWEVGGGAGDHVSMPGSIGLPDNTTADEVLEAAAERAALREREAIAENIRRRHQVRTRRAH
jgi:hypothetical protein